MQLVVLMLLLALIAAVSFIVMNKRKEKYTSGVALGPLLRSPNSETHDVLEWSLGGFGGSPRATC